MNSKKQLKLIIFPLLLLLAACQSVGSRSVALMVDVAEDNILEPGQHAVLPDSELTPEVMYEVLVGELAIRRNDADVGVPTFLALAERTEDPRLAEKATDLALLAGRLSEASIACELWQKLEPNSAQAKERWVLIQLRLGKWIESQTLLNEQLQRQPERRNFLFVQLAQMVELQFDKSAVFSSVQNLVKRYPDEPGVYFMQLTAAEALDNQQVVEQALAALARLAPEWRLPLLWQLDHLDDSAQGEVFILREIQRRPQASIAVKMLYPQSLIKNRALDKARVAVQALLKEAPNNANLEYMAAILAFELRDYTAAQQAFEYALALKHPASNFIFYALGQLAEIQKNPIQARRWYEQIQAGPQFILAQRQLVEMDLNNGDVTSAIKRLQRFADTPQEQQVLARLQAYKEREAGDYQQAKRILDQALKVYPKSLDLLYDRSLMLEMLGNIPQAEKDLKQLIQINPQDSAALNALGYILSIHTHRQTEALEYIERALKLDPDNPMIWDSLGWVQFKLGRKQAALKNLRRAHAQLKDPEVFAHLGEVLWALGQYNEARAIWREGLAIPGNQKALYDTLRRLGVKL